MVKFRYAKRLVIALAMSAGCYGGTELWYQSQLTDSIQSDKEPIAVLSNKLNEVQRKPLARVIWENLSNGENLFPGESIRTTQNSEAKILFLKTGMLIELEPDSQVVLEETKDGISLDFLKGNLFVKGGKKGTGKGITLKSGNSKISLDNANVNLSKSKKGALDLQVFGGTAKVTQGDKTMELKDGVAGKVTAAGLTEDKTILKVLSPKPGAPVYIDPRTREPVAFTFEKLPPGYRVYLEGGRSRKALKRNTKKFAKGEDGILKLPLKPGKIYWRLVAVPIKKGDPERRSPVMPAEILAKHPPTPLYPEDGGKVVTKGDSPAVGIKWATQITYDSMALEVSRDPNLKKPIVNLNSIMATSTGESVELKENGTYYWRVTGWMDINGKLTPVSSSIQKFELQLGVKLIPPTLRSPIAKQSLPFHQVDEEGLFLSWDPVPGIKKYKVTIKDLKKAKKDPSKGSHTKEAFNSPMKLKNLKPGAYEWSIVSIDPETAKVSKPSEVRRFIIEDLPSVKWVGGPDPATFNYVTNRPYLKAEWKPVKSAASYRVRYAQEGFVDETIKWLKAEKTFIRKFVDSAGKYDVQVEALSAKGKAIARSTIKTIDVREQPLLPAPSLASGTPEVLQSNRRGDVKLKWEAVDGAKSYKVQIKNQAGKVLREETVSRNLASINRLNPGEYTYTIQAIDEHKRVGPESVAKGVKVPKTSNIRAPKIKGIKVK